MREGCAKGGNRKLQRTGEMRWKGVRDELRGDKEGEKESDGQRLAKEQGRRKVSPERESNLVRG